MRVVAEQFEVFVMECVNIDNLRVQFHLWEPAWLAGELEFGLFEVIGVKVQVAESGDEFAGFQAADLRDHKREQGVRGDIEWHAEEKVGAALVKLATQPAIEHEELEEHVAR